MENNMVDHRTPRVEPTPESRAETAHTLALRVLRVRGPAAEAVGLLPFNEALRTMADLRRWMRTEGAATVADALLYDELRRATSILAEELRHISHDEAQLADVAPEEDEFVAGGGPS